ncbi:DapH/DapD/GlmU-related protein [Winogradskyella sp.]|uniref:serine O-acetyltransferase n=1 Tax=Winogradskyella sp. TaxID=1883156 RepID=UPI00261F691A|nr:DapH/DapD/GlmU-related protein [Winogradskyella sp.]
MLNAYKFYRLSHVLYQKKIPILPSILKLFIFLIYNSSIPFQAKIGKGSHFAYGGIGVVVHKNSVIGKNCQIGSNVTIGGRSGHQKVPIIGDNVYLATGSKILGPIEIGNNVTVGANAVVISNVPDNAVVGGVPAKIIKYINE